MHYLIIFINDIQKERKKERQKERKTESLPFSHEKWEFTVINRVTSPKGSSIEAQTSNTRTDTDLWEFKLRTTKISVAGYLTYNLDLQDV